MDVEALPKLDTLAQGITTRKYIIRRSYSGLRLFAARPVGKEWRGW